MPDTDQAQASEGTESGEVEEGVKSQITGKNVKTSTDNQEAQETEQSNQGKGESEESESKETEGRKYKTPDGRELSPDELYDEYNKLVPEFTRRSQRLSELEKQAKERKAEAGEEARTAVAEDEVLKNVQPEVREAIVRIVEPEIEKRLKQREEKQAQQRREEAFEEELQTLEKEYDGSDGLPKFDRNEVLRAMQEEGNRIYDPEAKFRQLHESEFVDYKVKQSLKQQGGGRESEETGVSGKKKKPESEPPKDFAEAAKRAISRISS